MLTASTRLFSSPGSPLSREQRAEGAALAADIEHRIALRRRRRALLEALFTPNVHPRGPLGTAERNVLWRSHHVRGRL